MKININTKNITEKLSEKFYLSLHLEEVSEGYKIRLPGINKGEGGHILIKIGLMRISASFVLDHYAIPLLRNMIDNVNKNLDRLSENIEKIDSTKFNIEFINENGIISLESIKTRKKFPECEKFNIKLKNIEEFSHENIEEVTAIIYSTIEHMMEILLSFIEYEYNNINEDTELDLPEGAISKIQINKYERNPLNRRRCIEKHGAICKVCSFDFEKFYGPIGAGFIHVHHIIPISQIGSDYLINPEKDLVPVCPNCHNMLHKNKDKPYTIEELKQIIDKNNNDK